jgi:hypothetical protein
VFDTFATTAGKGSSSGELDEMETYCFPTISSGETESSHEVGLFEQYERRLELSAMPG